MSFYVVHPGLLEVIPKLENTGSRLLSTIKDKTDRFIGRWPVIAVVSGVGITVAWRFFVGYQLIKMIELVI